MANSVRDLIGRYLPDMKLEEMFAVYEGDDDGRLVKYVEFFRDPELAQAYASSFGSHHRMSKTLVLASSTCVYPLESIGCAHILPDEERERKLLQEKILNQLPPEQQALFKDKKEEQKK